MARDVLDIAVYEGRSQAPYNRFGFKLTATDLHVRKKFASYVSYASYLPVVIRFER